jgi:hypothetical protein
VYQINARPIRKNYQNGLDYKYNQLNFHNSLFFKMSQTNVEPIVAMKKKKRSAAGESSKTASKKTKMDASLTLLHTAFGKKTIDSLTVLLSQPKNNGSSQTTYQMLSKSFELTLNKVCGTPLDCFLTTSGALTIFNFDEKDMEILNVLLHHLIKVLNVKPMYEPLLMERGNDSIMVKFFPCDAETQYFNKNWLIIRTLPYYCFHAQVTLAIKGLQFQSFGDSNMVKLYMTVGRVKVLDEDLDMNTIMGQYMVAK